MVLRVRVSQLGAALATRERARDLDGLLASAAAGAPAGSIVWLDFSGVSAVSPSFADELAARLQAFQGNRQTPFGILCPTAEIATILSGVFARRRLTLPCAATEPDAAAGQVRRL